MKKIIISYQLYDQIHSIAEEFWGMPNTPRTQDLLERKINSCLWSNIALYPELENVKTEIMSSMDSINISFFKDGYSVWLEAYKDSIDEND